MNKANRLREKDVIRRGGRGLSAAKIEPDDATSIILAAMSGASADKCAAAAETLSSLPLLNADGTKSPEISIKEMRGDDIILSVPTEDKAFGDAVEQMLRDSLTAEKVKFISFDSVNDHAMIKWIDGREDHFGKNGDFNSGATIMISGPVLVILSTAINHPRPSKAHLEWVRKVVKIGAEHGEAAAEEWMNKNPFVESEG